MKTKRRGKSPVLMESTDELKTAMEDRNNLYIVCNNVTTKLTLKYIQTEEHKYKDTCTIRRKDDDPAIGKKDKTQHSATITLQHSSRFATHGYPASPQKKKRQEQRNLWQQETSGYNKRGHVCSASSQTYAFFSISVKNGPITSSLLTPALINAGCKNNAE